jgi:hypothetical protein
MEQKIGKLLDEIPENESEYRHLLEIELKNFVDKYIVNEKNTQKQERNYRWLMNWIGKNCYEELSKKQSGECLKRKHWIESKYTEKEESLPFLDVNETIEYLKNNDKPFVSRFSSTIPGEITIQYLDPMRRQHSPTAKRFNYYTEKSVKDETIQEYIKTIIDSINQQKIKLNQRPINEKIYENYYSSPKKNTTSKKPKSPEKNKIKNFFKTLFQ